MINLYIICAFLIMFFLMALKIWFKDNILFYIFIVLYLSLYFLIPVLKYSEIGFSVISFSPMDYNISNEKLAFQLLLILMIFIFIFIMSYVIFGKIINKRDFLIFDGNFSNHQVEKLFYLTTIVGLIGSWGLVFSSGLSFQVLLNSSRFAFWDTKNTILYSLCVYLGFVLTIPSFLYGFYKINKYRMIYYISISSSIFINLVIFGRRTPIIALFGAYILGKLASPLKKSVKKSLMLVLVSFLLFHISVVWQYVRWQTSNLNNLTEWLNVLFIDSWGYYKTSLTEGGLSYFFDATIAALYFFPDQEEFLNGSTYLRLLLLPFPRSIFPFKPEETQRIFASVVNQDNYLLGGTYPPSLIGDIFINFGFYGVLMGVIFGFFIAYIQKKFNIIGMTPLKLGIGAGYFGFILLLFRGTFNGIYTLIFSLIVVILITKFTFKKLIINEEKTIT